MEASKYKQTVPKPSTSDITTVDEEEEEEEEEEAASTEKPATFVFSI